MSLQELIVIESTPAIVSVNFEELQTQLAKELERYDILVTAETLADAKKLAIELNKTKAIIATRRKEEVAKASEPVKAFDDSMKQLEAMCADGRKKILDQVANFEEVTKQEVAKLLSGCRDFLFEKHGVEPEFVRAEFDDLIKISALTATGKLTKSVKDDLQYRVLDDKRIQDRTKMRLLLLENQSYQAGLDAPLTKNHVNTFLNAEDDVYEEEVAMIIASELDRQARSEAKVRQRVEAEQAREQAAALVETVPEVVIDEPAPIKAQVEQPAVKAVEPELPEMELPEAVVAEPEPPTVQANCTVTCTFGINTSDQVTDEMLEDELRRVLTKAGITTLQTVSISRSQEQQAA